MLSAALRLIVAAAITLAAATRPASADCPDKSPPLRSWVAVDISSAIDGVHAHGYGGGLDLGLELNFHRALSGLPGNPKLEGRGRLAYLVWGEGFWWGIAHAAVLFGSSNGCLDAAGHRTSGGYGVGATYVSVLGQPFGLTLDAGGIQKKAAGGLNAVQLSLAYFPPVGVGVSVAPAMLGSKGQGFGTTIEFYWVDQGGDYYAGEGSEWVFVFSVRYGSGFVI